MVNIVLWTSSPLHTERIAPRNMGTARANGNRTDEALWITKKNCGTGRDGERGRTVFLLVLLSGNYYDRVMCVSEPKNVCKGLMYFFFPLRSTWKAADLLEIVEGEIKERGLLQDNESTERASSSSS